MFDKSKNNLSGKIKDLEESSGLAEKTPDYNNIKKDIERNLLIRVMPRKFKVSTGKNGHPSKIVGAVIIVFGILVMAAAIYIGYIYLINPKGGAVTTRDKVLPAETVQEEQVEPEVSIEKEVPAQVEEDILTPTTTEEEGWISSTASTSAAENSSSTVSEIEKPVASGADVDSDGLTDAEEAILATDPLKADSDSDTYSDFSELMNSYDPAGAGKLADNSNLRMYGSTRFQYSALVPAAWNTKETGQGESVIFSAPDNSFFQIVGSLNPEKKDILSWYNNQFISEPAAVDDVVANNGWQGIYSADKNIFYLTDIARNNIYSLSYVPADSATEAYKNIFQAFVNSFSLK